MLEVRGSARPRVGLVARVGDRLLHEARDHLALDARLRQPARKPARCSEVVDELRAGVRTIVRAIRLRASCMSDS